MAKIKKVVVDASVAVKWFSSEEHSDKALRLIEMYEKEGADLSAPALLPYEVGNALRYNPGFGIEDVKEALTALDDLQIRLHPLKKDLTTLSIELAFTYGLTIYDSAYMAVAANSGSTVYTADEDLVGKVSQDFVKHISELI